MLRKDTIAGNGAFSFLQFTQANSGFFSLLSVSACKDTIQGNVGLGNSGTSMDMRDDSDSCLILRGRLAYYCASISREERPVFVVKLNENDNKDRTKEPKGALQSAKLAQCQHILSIRVKEKCNNKLSF